MRVQIEKAMNKQHFLLIALLYIGLTDVFAARTCYQFTNATWSSKVGTVITDGKTDGFSNIAAGTDYAAGRTYQSGDETITESRGVHITTNSSNAGAESVLEFTQIREIVFSYCTNASKGQGSIFVKVGNNEEQEIIINKPEKGQGSRLKEASLTLEEQQTGKISFRVECKENAIYIDAITIKAQNSSPNVSGLTYDMFTILTNIDDLQNGDSVIFGTTNQQNYVMGLYDEWNSRNNIYALKATYSADRTIVNKVDGAVYTAYRTEDNNFIFADEDGYFIVASGGNPNNGSNNYLTVWNDYTSSSYGNYGIWQISVDMFGNATIMNLGTSASKYLQFNYNGGTPIFACYKELTQTPVVLYRKERMSDINEPKIQASIVTFGDIDYSANNGKGHKTIEINAINLTEPITAMLKSEEQHVFSISTSQIDQDGDRITISFDISTLDCPITPVVFTDTLILRSGKTEKRVPIVMRVHKQLTIAEAKQLEQLTPAWLSEVIVTKKYNMHIFVKDQTGDMLLFDSGNVYGKDLKNGHILTGVSGSYKSYYGNPQIALNAPFERKQGNSVLPETITQMPTAEDACKYVRIENAVFIEKNTVSIGTNQLPLYNLFNLEYQLIDNATYNIEGIVYYYDGVVLCPSAVEFVQMTGIEQGRQEVLIQDGNILNPQREQIYIYDISGKQLYNGNDTKIEIPRSSLTLILRISNKFVQIIH